MTIWLAIIVSGNWKFHDDSTALLTTTANIDTMPVGNGHVQHAREPSLPHTRTRTHAHSDDTEQRPAHKDAAKAHVQVRLKSPSTDIKLIIFPV
jgi:hypothetical protein